MAIGTGTVISSEPVTASEVEDIIRDAGQAINDVMDSFPDDDEFEEGPEQVKEAKGFLNKFINYIKSNVFHDDIMEVSKKYKVPPKKLANGFFESCLGTIGDILGVAINTAGNAAHTLVDILATLIHGGINLVVKVANGLASIVTLNKTCVKAA